MMTKFDNGKATDAARVAYLDAKNAKVKDLSDEEDDPDWHLFYTAEGRDQSIALDALTWEDAVFEGCEILS